MNKACGDDGIKNECWKYGGKPMTLMILSLANKTFESGQVSQLLNKVNKIPIYKKGDK